MATSSIPLLADTTDQLFDVELSGNPYTLRVLWNERGGYFSLSVMEYQGNMILENIKMVKDYPLIGRFKDTRLPIGDLYFIDNKGKNERPIYESAGTDDYVLFYFESETTTTTAETVITAATPVSGSIWDSGLTTWNDGGTISTWDGA